MCYRNKATDRFLLCSRRGLELLDVQGDDHTINWWVRAICQYGFMPCTGLIYAPSHPCHCFTRYKFDGFHALAAADESQLASFATEASNADRLFTANSLDAFQPPPPIVRPAAAPDSVWVPRLPNLEPQEWPTYRHDTNRSGAVTAERCGRKQHPRTDCCRIFWFPTVETL